MFKQGLNSNGEPLRSAYVEHDPIEYICEDGLTRQEFADECDINVLMARYETTGTISHFNGRAPQFLDVSSVPDMHQAMSVLHAAEVAFMTLPASVRKEFDNDPIKFVEFAEDPENLPQMRSWKLAPEAPVEAPPQRVEIVNPPEPAPAAS